MQASESITAAHKHVRMRAHRTREARCTRPATSDGRPVKIQNSISDKVLVRRLALLMPHVLLDSSTYTPRNAPSLDVTTPEDDDRGRRVKETQ